MKISVVVPLYNAEQTLERCVLSITSQTYRDIEILLIDDGSRDRSWDICMHLKKMDSRITAIQKKNGGVSTTRNIGIQKATGEWITFVDSDDYIEPDMLLTMSKYTNQTELVCCSSKKSDGSSFVCFNDDSTDSSEFEAGRVLLFGTPWGKMFKRLIIKKNKISFDESLSKHEDTVFFWKYLNYVHRISTVSYIGYVYCIQTSEQSLHNKIVQPRLLLKTHDVLLLEYTNLLDKYIIEQTCKQKIESWLFSFLPQIFLDSYRCHLSRKEKCYYWIKLRRDAWNLFPERIPKWLLPFVKINNFGCANIICELYIKTKFISRNVHFILK